MQVFDLQHFRPGPVLKQIWANFEAAAKMGDPQAELVKRSAGLALFPLWWWCGRCLSRR